ncbi:MAG: hypothetical protein N5P05_004105 (plasmid) [Chroococcopsis gigantea SAG 12.99]|jgi:hypothetical protein|nr:hypothetical protein [Chroococcopsis gigantea SAG 12.99]
MNISFKYWTCRIVVTKYAQNGSIAINLVDAINGSPITTATVNLSPYGLVPEPNQCYIKDYAENEGILKSLVMAGAVIPVKIVRFGPYSSPAVLCKLSPKLIEELSATA